MKRFAPVQSGGGGGTTLNGEQKLGSNPTDNTKRMNFEIHSSNGSSGENGVFNSVKV